MGLVGYRNAIDGVKRQMELPNMYPGICEERLRVGIPEVVYYK